MGVDSDAETALAWDRGELEVTKVEGAAPAVVAFQVQPTVGAVTSAFGSMTGSCGASHLSPPVLRPTTVGKCGAAFLAGRGSLIPATWK